MKTVMKFLFAALMVGGVSLGARPASADFTLCNDFKQTIYAAYGYYSDYEGDWVSEGWWEVRPNQCVILESGQLQGRYRYLFAETADGRTWWDGEYFFCTHEPNAFTIIGDEQCNTGFFEVDMQNYRDWVHRLTP